MSTVHQLLHAKQNADPIRQRRLGQYFTGPRLASLTAALARAHEAKSVLDPMVGTGDMLTSSISHGGPKLVGGIELDPFALAQCAFRMNEFATDGTALISGSSFSPDAIAALPTTSWDVVITNPPYVRYQRGSNDNSAGISIPGASQVREDLFASVDLLDALDEADKRAFRELIMGYSGLADLAVPSWLLCAALVREGGRLAMLVPTTWMTRNYAHPVRYMLARWFDLDVVVEDADASWFAEAQVRTSIVVATRVPRRNRLADIDAKRLYPHVRLSSSATDERSLVAAGFPDSLIPDLEFARAIQDRNPAKQNGSDPHWKLSLNSSRHDADEVGLAASREKWFRVLEPQARAFTSKEPVGPHLPTPMRRIVGESAAQLVDLESIGWTVGQGLRTGANQFFYVRHVETSEDCETLESTAAFGSRFSISSHAALPVLRKQSALTGGFSIRADRLVDRVLALEGLALPEDVLVAAEVEDSTALDAAGHDLAEYIRAAASANVGTETEPKQIPTLSAVAPNVRAAAAGRPARFWYQLPSLSERHRPALFIARVNARHPRAYLNVDRAAVVDANFSTLWPIGRLAPTSAALLALLNSAWCAAYFECACTVMGGGALKLEAAHVRRLPLPIFNESDWRDLSSLGIGLASNQQAGATIDNIDRVISRKLAPDAPNELTQRLQALTSIRLKERS